MSLLVDPPLPPIKSFHIFSLQFAPSISKTFCLPFISLLLHHILIRLVNYMRKENKGLGSHVGEKRKEMIAHVFFYYHVWIG